MSLITGLWKCTACGHWPAWHRWLFQPFLTAATIFLWFYPPVRLGFGLAWLLLLYFALVALIDIEHRLILHPVSLAGALIGLVVGWVTHGITSTLLGGLAGGLVMALIYLFGVYFSRWLSRRRGTDIEDALGFGDVTLSFVLGLILGWPGIAAGLILAVLSGGVVSLVYIASGLLRRNYQPFQALPYGPFLVFGASILLFLRDPLLKMLGN